MLRRCAKISVGAPAHSMSIDASVQSVNTSAIFANADEKPCLRFGVVVEGSGLERWQFNCVSGVIRSGMARLALTVTTQRTPMWSKLKSKFRANQILWHAFRLTSGRLHSETLMKEVPFCGLRVFDAEFETDANLAPCQGVTSGLSVGHGLDFILDFRKRSPKAALCNMARLGVWKFSWGTANAEAFGFWEVLRAAPVVRVALRRFTPYDPPSGSSLRTALFPVSDRSYKVTVDRARLGSADLPVSVCRYLLAGGAWEPVAEPPQEDDDRASLPSNLSVLLFAWRLLRRKILWLGRALFTRIQWNSGFIASGDINPEARSMVRNVNWLELPGDCGHYAADPFIRKTDNGYIVLAETIGRIQQKGVIVAFRLSDTGVASLGTAIEREGIHLSYPCIVEWKGEIYCVPEQHQAEAILIYQAIEFPTRWKRIGELLSGVKAVDPTLFRYGAYWWLAYTEVFPFDAGGWDRGVHSDHVSRLMLWYANDPRGPWSPHVMNPVKIDARSRGGGAPFYYKGQLIRPSQDCSLSYGAKILFNRVTALDPMKFEEQLIGELSPDPNGPYPEGLHNISVSGPVAAIDGCRLVFDPLSWFGKLRTRRRRAAVTQ